VSGEGSLFDVPPAAIGRFRVLHQVGAGASGPVFRAVHPETDAPLAIKLFTLSFSPERVASIVADLESLVNALPTVDGGCQLVDAGTHGSTPYLVTSFAQGDSLDVAIKQFGPASILDLVPRLKTLARALDAAAGDEVLHGALHPRDIVVSDTSTVMTGLGIWPILAHAGARLPVRRPYRAPELSDAGISAAGDRFSLAALTYEWMTGRRAPSTFVAGDMAPIAGADRELLGLIFARALHADPEERYPTCAAFVRDLADIDVEETPVAAVEKPRAEARPRKRGARSSPGPAPLPLDVFPAEDPGDLRMTPFVAEEPVPREERAHDEGRLAHDEPIDREESVDHEEPVHHEEPRHGGSFFEPERFEPERFEPERSELSRVAPAAATPLRPVPVPEAPAHAILRDEVYTPPRRARTAGGLRRLMAGLLLGIALGVGAGYAAWGREGGLQFLRSLVAGDEAPTDRSTTPDASPIDAPTTNGTPPAAQAGSTPPEAPDATAGAPSPARELPAPAAPAPGPPAASAPSPSVARPAPAGNLLVRSTPAGATVFVDDERRGVTPMALQNIELGTRRVRIQRDGFNVEERQINLTRSRPSRSVDVRLTRAAPAPRPAPPAPATPAVRTGSLVIESRPIGATIVLNGREVGTTPMTIDDLEPGTYTVQLQLPNFRPIRTTVRVVAGSRARAAASLVNIQDPQ
jgi:PEGA domain/Protein kinase domain